MTTLPPNDAQPPDAIAQHVADAVAAETAELKSQLANLREENEEMKRRVEWLKVDMYKAHGEAEALRGQVARAERKR